jgi:hypothetical protein
MPRHWLLDFRVDTRPVGTPAAPLRFLYRQHAGDQFVGGFAVKLAQLVFGGAGMVKTAAAFLTQAHGVVLHADHRLSDSCELSRRLAVRHRQNADDSENRYRQQQGRPPSGGDDAVA